LTTVTETTKIQTKASSTRSSGILSLLSMAQLVVVLDFSIVQVALPSMRNELGISIADSQWIVSAYGLTFAGLLLLSGRISDLQGRRKLFSIGLIIFAVSSLAAGLAPSELVIIASRAVQGIGAAIASATSLSLVVVSFNEGPERNRALSVFSAVSSAGFAVGVVLGGVLTASLGWRSIFFINVPIGIVAALLARRYIAESRDDSINRHLDIPGSILVTSGLSLLVYALTVAANTSLISFQTFGVLGLASVFLISFFMTERRSKNPLMPLAFLRRRNIFAPNVIAILIASTSSSMIFLLTIYLQQIQGFSALSAGLAFLPTGIVWLVVSGFLSARFVTRFGMRPTLVGSMVVLTIGLLLLSRITTGTPFFTFLLPSLLVASVGTGFGWTAFYIAALSGADHGEEGLASGIVNTSIQVGAPVGLALSVTIATAVTAPLAGQIGVAASTVAGFDYAFLGDLVLAAIGVVFAAVLLGRPKNPEVQVSAASTVQKPLLKLPSSRLGEKSPTISERIKGLEIRKILVAVDGSQNGSRAAETAMRLAKDYGAELIILRAVTIPNTLTPTGHRGGVGGSLILKEFYEYARKDAEDYVAALVSEANNFGVRSARGVVVRAMASPVSAIINKANGEGVDIIVIGSRGLDRPKRLLLGSVSAGVVADANSQVLVVR